MSVIFVAENTEDVENSEMIDDVFVINEEYRKIGEEEYDKWYRTLSSANVSRVGSVPVYEIAWQHIISKNHGRLHEFTILGMLFSRYIDQFDTPTIIYHNDIDDGYKTVLTEVANAVDAQIKDEKFTLLAIKKTKHLFVTSVLLLPFLIDQFIGIITSLFRPPTKSETVFVPALGRLTSMLPVIKNADFDYNVVVASNSNSFYFAKTTNKLNPYDPTPLSAYTSIRCLFKQIRAYASIIQSVFIKQQFSEEISAVLEEKSELKLNKTVTYSIMQGFGPRIFIAIFKYFLYRRLISQTGAEKLIVGTLAPGGRAGVCATIDQGSSSYHIPHSIATYTCPNPPEEMTQFVAGSLDKQYYSESPQVAKPWKCVITGRPYLSNVYQCRHDFESKSINSSQILIATQPLPHKKEFVRQVINAIVNADLNWDIILKIHPDEKLSEYTDLATEFPAINIQVTDLFSHLADSDLTITINSNVGLESILLGTPTVLFNQWQPISMDPPYAMYGPIPVYRTRNDLSNFLTQLDSDILLKLQNNQIRWVKKEYVLNSDAPKNIAESIKND